MSWSVDVPAVHGIGQIEGVGGVEGEGDLAVGVVACAPGGILKGLLDVDDDERGAVGGEHGVDCMLGHSLE
jgi:hypothetical protein